MTPFTDKTQNHPVLEEFSRVASQYDMKWSFYVEATVRETMARISLQPEDRLLDIGCGTGTLLYRLSHTHPLSLLSGVDPTPEMLAAARNRLPTNIELCEGWVEKLPFETERFDVVVSCSMFHYIRQPMKALHEMARVLRPGGRLIMTDWCDDYIACRICDLYLRRFKPAHFKTYRIREWRSLLNETRYRHVEIQRYKINWFWGLMTAKAIKP